VTFPIQLSDGPLAGMSVRVNDLDDNRIIHLPDERKLYVYERISELDYRFDEVASEIWNLRYDAAVRILSERGFDFTPCELVTDGQPDEPQADDEQ
jgi:hypothetical protein